MDGNDSFGRSINNSVLYREQVAWLSHEKIILPMSNLAGLQPCL
ncbi:MAG: hypothetical protein ACLUW4_02675 [Butyribacter sp.]|nr:hypothetical protein [Roseburia hominis]